MTFPDLLKFSIQNMRRRKKRTILTVFGIVLGSALIILMVSLGLGSAAATDELVKKWGNLTIIEVYSSDEQLLNSFVLQEFKTLEYVTGASPLVHFSDISGELLTGNNARYVCDLWNVTGIDGSFMSGLGYRLINGSYLSDLNIGNDAIPVVVSENTAYDFHDANKQWEDPQYMRSRYDENGEETGLSPFFDISTEPLVLRIHYNFDENDAYDFKEFKLIVVGTLAAENESGQNASGIYMNLSDMKKIENEYRRLNSVAARNNVSQSYNTVYIKVDNIEHVDDVEKVLANMGYETYSMNKVRNEMQSQVLQSQLTLAGIAAVSLLVAAMNIVNTMNTAILERVKEIGIMKVIGCTPSVIQKLFLLESSILGLTGGVIGSLIGELLSGLINHFPEWSVDGTIPEWLSGLFVNGNMSMSEATRLSIVPFWLIISTVVFTVTVGVLAGLAPAGKAVRISSLEAIRYE